MLAFTPIPTRPSFASVSSSTVFGPAAIFLAPPPTRAEAHKHAVAQQHHRRSLRVWTRQQQQQAEDGFELLGSVDDDDGATSDAGSDVTLVAAGQNEKVVECKGQEVEVSSRRAGQAQIEQQLTWPSPPSDRSTRPHHHRYRRRHGPPPPPPQRCSPPPARSTTPRRRHPRLMA